MEHITGWSEIKPALLFECTRDAKPVVGQLPEGCPLQEESALAALHVLKERAYEFVDQGGGQRAIGLALLNNYEACNRCVDRALLQPAVQVLRASRQHADD